MAKKSKTSQIQGLYSRATAWGEYQHNYLTDPDRILAKLNMDASQAFMDTESDGHLTAVKASRFAAVKSLEWDIEKGETGSRTFKEVERFFKSININQFIDDVLSAVAWGFAPIAIDWQAKSGLLLPSPSLRPTKWFLFSPSNELRFKSQSNPIIGDEIKPKSLILVQHGATYQNPYGEKLLSKSYWPVFFKRNVYKWWARFIEKFAIPYLYAKVPQGTPQTKRDEIADMLENMLQDSIAVLPGGPEDSINILEQQGKTGSADIMRGFVEYMNAELSKIWLGETLTTEVGDVGSYSASKTHQGTKDERRDQDKVMVERAANQLIEWVVEMNFGGAAPVFTLSAPRTENLVKSQEDVNLHTIGFRPKKEYFISQYGKDPDEFDLATEQSNDWMKAGEEEAKPGDKKEPVKQDNDNIPEEDDDKAEAQFAEGSVLPSMKEVQATIDKAKDGLSGPALQAQAEDFVLPVIKAVEGASNYNEALEKILTTWPAMRTDEAMARLEKAMFWAQTLGRLAAGSEARK